MEKTQIHFIIARAILRTTMEHLCLPPLLGILFKVTLSFVKVLLTLPMFANDYAELLGVMDQAPCSLSVKFEELSKTADEREGMSCYDEIWRSDKRLRHIALEFWYDEECCYTRAKSPQMKDSVASKQSNHIYESLQSV
jgi:hypothetical protein